MKMLLLVVLILALLVGVSTAKQKQGGDQSRNYCMCDLPEDLDGDGICDDCLLCIRIKLEDGSGKD